jgi:hypothetical protein
MRRLNVILAVLVIASGIPVESVRACRFLTRSSSRCCVSRCCQPVVSLPTVCGPARAVDSQVIGAVEQPLAVPAEDVPEAAPEIPPAPQPEEAPAVEAAPPQEPAFRPEGRLSVSHAPFTCRVRP